MADEDDPPSVPELTETLKSRWTPTIHAVLSKVPLETERLWMAMGLDMLPHWRNIPFEDTKEEVHVLITLLMATNMIMMKHHSQVLMILDALQIYTKAVVQYFRFFKDGGYKYFLLEFAKVYDMADASSEIRKMLGLAWSHFYRLHGQEFLVQAVTYLSPLSQTAVFTLSPNTIIELLESNYDTSSQKKTHWYSATFWTPPAPVDVDTGVIPTIRMLICMLLYSPTKPAVSHFVQMLNALIPTVMLPPWEFDQHECLEMLHTMFDSMRPKGFRVNYQRMPFIVKVGLVELLCSVMEYDDQAFEKHSETLHDCIASILQTISLQQSEALFIADQSATLTWMHCFFHQCTINPDSKYNLKILTSCFNACEAQYQWIHWDTLFYSIAHFVQTVPAADAQPCKNLIFTRCVEIASIPDLPRNVLCTLVHCISACSFVICLTECEMPALPNLPITATTVQNGNQADTEQSKTRARHIPDFHNDFLGPLIKNLSGGSVNMQDNPVWSWITQYCIDCINNQVAVLESLSSLHQIIVFGHRNIGSLSSSITTVLVLLQDCRDNSEDVPELCYQILLLAYTMRPGLCSYLFPFIKHLSCAPRAPRAQGEERVASLPVSRAWRPIMPSVYASQLDIHMDLIREERAIVKEQEKRIKEKEDMLARYL